MALKDLFKKIGRKEGKKPEKKTEKKTEKKIEQKAAAKGKKPALRKKKAVSKIDYSVLKSPRITEKATLLKENDCYVFEVKPTTNKIEVKKAVEKIYNVNVLSVNIINVPRKKRRKGRVSGWKKGYKKAIVKVKKGQKIEELIK